MSESPPRLSKPQLNWCFLNGLGEAVLQHSGMDSVPLLVDLCEPYPLRLRAYFFNGTNPPGGRARDEYKAQVILPGQARDMRGVLDYSDGRMPVLTAYVRLTEDEQTGVFVLWDPDKHIDFAYSTNLQVKADVIIRALSSTLAQHRRSNGEVLIAARPSHLLRAIRARADIMLREVEI